MALAATSALSVAQTLGKESSKWRFKNNPRIDMRFDRPAHVSEGRRRAKWRHPSAIQDLDS
jgi:hypothetical protein